ncbi:4-alpha-glucanotransferase, partial [Streptomyces filamentosus NRRL 15998]
HVRTPDNRRATATLVAAPPRVPQPPERTHGFLVQLYSLLSARSWGMGDLGDLTDLATWAGRSVGSGFVQVNPLHAAVPGKPTDPSPYRPSSRRFPDPVHLHVESIPEYGHVRDRATLDDLRQDAAALSEAVLNKGALIDRDAVWELKRQALELVVRVPLTPGRRADYCDFLAEQGQALEDHALWCALAEVHGPDWHTWPEALRDPRSPGTARARSELLDRVDFHCRLAWLTAGQLAAAQRAAEDAGMGVGIVHDLAVGVHPGRRRHLVPAGGLRPRHVRRRAARRVQRARPGLGPAALAPRHPRRHRLRRLPGPAARAAGPRRGPAHRPRDGPLPALVGPRGPPAHRRHVRRVRRRGDARRPRPGGPPGRGRRRRRGPRHRRPRGP